MADFNDVVQNRNDAYDKIWNIAQEALNTLKASARNSTAPVLGDIEDLHFDPGAPTKILLQLPFDIQPLFQKIDDYIQRINNVPMPTLPPTPNFVMLDHEVWDEQFMDDLKTNLWSYVQSMGIPDVSYQNAIFNEDYERNLQIVNDLFDLADSKTGARGFSYPNDYGQALKIDAQVKYQYDRTQVSRTIVKTVTEWARQNYQFAIEKGITHQQAHMDFTYKYCTAFVSIYKEMIAAILAQYKTQMEIILAPVNLLAEEVRIFMDYAKVAAEIDKTNETLKQSRSEIEIKEALQKYGNDTTRLVNEFQQQLEQIRQAAQHSAGLAQATTSSVIGYTKG